MFFLRELEREITLHPSFFGPRTREYLTTRLLEDVEGSCTGQYYIITVLDTVTISEGRVVPGSGVAEYTIQYRAVVWRPFKGETVQLIPPDIKWDPNATPPQYTDNGDQVIEKGTHLRIKLIGTRSDVGSMFAIGSVKEDFLGSVTYGLLIIICTYATRSGNAARLCNDTEVIYRLIESTPACVTLQLQVFMEAILFVPAHAVCLTKYLSYLLKTM
ncbi:MAG: hypothetical protein Q9186_005088 [Xanthomendoza sp. 1 TL-2023]